MNYFIMIKFTLLTNLSLFVCEVCSRRVVSTLLEVDISPFELLNVRQVLTLGLKSEVTLKVYPRGVLNRNFGGGVPLVLQKPDPVLN